MKPPENVPEMEPAAVILLVCAGIGEPEAAGDGDVPGEDDEAGDGDGDTAGMGEVDVVSVAALIDVAHDPLPVTKA